MFVSKNMIAAELMVSLAFRAESECEFGVRSLRPSAYFAFVYAESAGISLSLRRALRIRTPRPLYPLFPLILPLHLRG